MTLNELLKQKKELETQIEEATKEQHREGIDKLKEPSHNRKEKCKECGELYDWWWSCDCQTDKLNAIIDKRISDEEMGITPLLTVAQEMNLYSFEDGVLF